MADLAFSPFGRHVSLEHGLGLTNRRKLPTFGLHQVQGVLQVDQDGFQWASFFRIFSYTLNSIEVVGGDESRSVCQMTH